MSGTWMLILYVVLFGAIFYFLAIRPQRKQKSQHQEMVSMLKRGDEVLTIGGMYGTVKKVGPDWVVIEVARGTQIRFLKRAISSITTPVNEDEDEYVEDEEYEEYDEEGEYAEEEYAEEEYDEEAGDEESAEDGEEAVEQDASGSASADEEEVPAAPEAPAAEGAKKGKAS